MKFNTKTRESLLKDVINFYNSNNRAINTDGRCFYYHEGKRCAIGMCIPESKAKKLPNGTVEDVFNDLPKYAQKLGKQFLLGIQSLHDMNYYWDENGLSKSGKERVEFIIKEYDLKIEL